MKIFKKTSTLFMVIVFLLSTITFSSCDLKLDSGIGGGSDGAIGGIAQGMPTPNGQVFDYDNYFVETFNDGIDYDVWALPTQAWGGDNGGVIPQNVHYTEDGVLLLEAHGLYYSGDVEGISRPNGTKTGSAIISKDTYGYGRYEVRMKVLPRLGVCNAFWTYANLPSPTGGINENHEIDVELPGTNISYESVYNTNWETEEAKCSIATETATPANDGEWHTYGFDWMKDKIIYYIDGQKVDETGTHIPYAKSRIWAGVWFPKDWCGTPWFDTDYMQVDWLYHIPFVDQQGIKDEHVEIGNSAAVAAYPKTPAIKKELSSMANGNFEYLPIEGGFTSSNVFNSWKSTKFRVALESKELTYTEDKSEVISGNRSMLIKDGYIAYTDIDGVYENFVYEVKFNAKQFGDNECRVKVIFFQSADIRLQTDEIVVSSSELKNYVGKFKAPAKTQRVRIQVESNANGGGLIIDDIELNYLGYNV